jgi:hypothetical protein
VTSSAAIARIKAARPFRCPMHRPAKSVPGGYAVFAHV